MTAEDHMEAAYQAMLLDAHRHARKYIDEFMRLKCAPDLLRLGLFPNAKEIQESMGAFHAVVDHLGLPRLADPDVALVAVADGRTPRTGALFSFRSRWSCTSVDPLLQPFGGVARLEVVPKTVEDWRLDWPNTRPLKRWPLVVIAAVHSHAPLKEAYKAVASAADEVLVVAMPCCESQTLDWPPQKRWKDYAVGSPKREVLLWHIKHVRREVPDVIGDLKGASTGPVLVDDVPVG